MPLRVVQTGIPPEQRERFALLDRWLAGFPRPPRPWDDETDPVRWMAWRERVAAYPPSPAAPPAQPAELRFINRGSP